MRSDTTWLLARPYLDVVDDILTAIVGGVVNEAIEFDEKNDVYPLSEPAQSIRSITGSVVPEGSVQLEPYTFQPGIDYEFDAGRSAVAWLQDGVTPADETSFYVDYLRPGVDPPLTDVNVGSVTRVISEAIGREITVVYQQILEAYRAAFLETAQGTSLDLVVSILGLTRKGGSSATGLVTFFRAGTEGGTITIPEAFEVRTKTGTVSFETTAARTMQRGQSRIDVPVRAAVGFEGDVGKVPAGEITEMAQRIEGIDHITNVAPTALGGEDESDDDLRARARATLRALGKATLAALELAVSEQAGKLLEVWDPSSAAKPSPAGQMSLLVEAEPEALLGLRSRVNETRAAGVLASVVARYVYFKPRMVVEVAADLPPQGKEKVVGEAIAALQSYVDGLSSGVAALGEGLSGALAPIDGLEKATFVDVMSWRSDVVRPGPELLVESLVAAADVAAGDQDALRTAYERILSEDAPLAPTTARIADRSLVVGPVGEPATDAEIQAGSFQVVPPTDGTWWVALDIEPSDIFVAVTE